MGGPGRNGGEKEPRRAKRGSALRAMRRCLNVRGSALRVQSVRASKDSDDIQSRPLITAPLVTASLVTA